MSGCNRPGVFSTWLHATRPALCTFAHFFGMRRKVGAMLLPEQVSAAVMETHRKRAWEVTQARAMPNWNEIYCWFADGAPGPSEGAGAPWTGGAGVNTGCSSGLRGCCEYRSFLPLVAWSFF